MITGFEQETAPLNEIELRAAEIISYCLNKGHVGNTKAVTAQHICNALAQQDARFRTEGGKPYLNGARVRKIMNHLRTSKICPRLIANSKGYYISNDHNEITEYIISLRARAAAINAVADAMSAAMPDGYVQAK